MQEKTEMTIKAIDGTGHTYHSFYQRAMAYGEYSQYVYAHGCAVCAVTTVLRAFAQAYDELTPEQTIIGIEKQVLNPAAWRANHVTKKPRRQMPISMKGMHAMLQAAGITAMYIPKFKDADAKADILAHLKKGLPVMVEVGRRNRQTNRRSTRWTFSYHTMVLIDVLADGRVLIADSANRDWYTDEQRFKIAAIDDILPYMYPCLFTPVTDYFREPFTSGGYIKIG